MSADKFDMGVGMYKRPDMEFKCQRLMCSKVFKGSQMAYQHFKGVGKLLSLYQIADDSDKVVGVRWGLTDGLTVLLCIECYTAALEKQK